MSRFQATVTVAIFSLPGISAGEWYRIQSDSPTTIRIHADGQSLKVPVRKVQLPVSALVLRRDTERSDWCWVEVTLPDQLQLLTFEYIHAFYNPSRLHFSLDYQSPLDFERNLNQSSIHNQN